MTRPSTITSDGRPGSADGCRTAPDSPNCPDAAGPQPHGLQRLETMLRVNFPGHGAEVYRDIARRIAFRDDFAASRVAPAASAPAAAASEGAVSPAATSRSSSHDEAARAAGRSSTPVHGEPGPAAPDALDGLDDGGMMALAADVHTLVACAASVRNSRTSLTFTYASRADKDRAREAALRLAANATAPRGGPARRRPADCV